MRPHEPERSVAPVAPAADTPRVADGIPQVLLARSPLGVLVRRVAALRASVHAKLLGAFLLIALLLIAMGAMSLRMITSVSRQSRLLDQARERVDASRQIEQALGVQMDVTRNALLLRDDAAIESILRDKGRFDDALARLEEAAPPGERETIARLRAAQAEALATVGQVAGLIREGKHDEAMALHLGEGQPRYREITALVTRVVRAEEAGMGQLRQSVEAANRRALLLTGGFAGASIVLALLLGFVTSWSFILPVRLAEAFLGRVAKGDFRATIDVPNRDEFGVLADRMNRMSRELHRLYDEQGRLLGELEGRNRELSEALEQQTATGEILRVISSSPTDVQPIFDAIVASSVRLCDASFGGLLRFDGEALHVAAAHNVAPEKLDIFRHLFPMRPTPDVAVGRAILERRTIHFEDVLREPTNPVREAARKALGYRAWLSVPMVRDGVPLGVIFCWREEPRAFSEPQVALVQTFADQAVIAIENVRLFTELEARNRELTEALEQQTATGEILRAISGSPTDIQPVLDTVARAAARFCGATDVAILRLDGHTLRGAAGVGSFPELIARQVGGLTALEVPVTRGSVTGRAVVERRTVHVHDLAAEPEDEFPEGRELQRRLGHHTMVATPLLREGAPLGVIALFRMVVDPFSDKQLELLRTFADQAVIAIENVRLFTEVQARNRELSEALERQTATAEVLKVISRSAFDLQPVLEVLAENATRLCRAEWALVYRFDGTVLRVVADYGAPVELRRSFAAGGQGVELRPGRGSVAGRAAAERRTAHIPDVLADPEYEELDAQRHGGFRAGLGVPMLRDGTLLGVFFLARNEPRPFTNDQVELVTTFADQAVIAIENVRLFTELEARNRDLTETLEQQTATAEILRVISSSPTDVQPVFDAIADSAARLCEAHFCHLFRFDGELLHFVAQHGLSPEGVEAVRRGYPMAPGRGSAAARAVLSGLIEHIPDVHTDPDYGHAAIARAATFRSIVAVPMVRDGVPIGAIAVARSQAGRFPDRQIELLKTFADQAVIAIENVRLFTELEARNRDLTETLEQQTATSEILRVISSSPTDVQPVFDTIAKSGKRLCQAQFCHVFRYDGERVHFVAHHGLAPEGVEAMRGAFPMTPSQRSTAGRSILQGAVAHIPDVHADPDYGLSAIAKTITFRATLGVPMLREGLAVGAITVSRSQPGPFTDRQIELLQTFADQAVIAIENVRLFKELEARNRDLTETLEQQTATSEVLKVISRSTFDLQPVLETLIENATRLCNADAGVIYKLDGELQRLAAAAGISPELRDFILRNPLRSGRGTAVGRALAEGQPAHIHDVLADPHYTYPGARLGDYRTILGVPMLREGVPIGVFAVWRREVLPFTSKQVDLVTTFADQGAIAIENVRLFQELEARTRDLTRSVGELRALGEVSQAVSSTLDLETVLETIVSRAVQLSGSDSGLVYEFEEATETFHARATHQISPEHLVAVRAAPIHLGEGAVGRAGVIREPVQVADIADETQLVAAQTRGLLVREGMRSLLAVPLIREGRLLGGLVIIRREGGAFSPEVVATLQTFAAQSVLAIHNAGLFREIQRQKQYADALVETSPVAIATMDLDGAVVGWNPGAERLFGYTPAEALGRRMEDLVATPEVRENIRANIHQTLEGEGVRAIGRRARKDGTLVDVEISSMPVTVEGARVGMIGIYHDITELLRARREAEAANEAKSAFLATMSHEIRTPLNAVIGMSGLLLNTPLTDEQREYAEVVRQSGDALLTVINDILDFSKIEAGRLELESQPFDLRECVEGALDLVATRAAEKGLDLAYLVGDGTPPSIVGDVTRLRQVLLNLLSNAVKFTERGEVVLSVSARRLDGPDALHELTFSVRDTGIGIPADRLGRLFQSFSQVDASTTRRYGGTGLGLAISQRLTELMGGRISVTSELGSGSEFRFTIRAAAAAELPVVSRRDLSGVQPSLRGKHVLVVDDNATNRRIVTTHLGTWGLPARAAASPGEALEWIQAGERFDVGILDMHMPEMDGVTLARAIRGHPAGATLPLILFTSLGRREARAEEEGFAAYLHKPIKPSQLFDALVSVLADQPVHVPERGVARSELDPDMARRHSLRILLAEDNVVNQKVALRLLGQLGYRVDLAANGLEAIAAVERQTYDVVLMDVQMPELDGFEASREINRRWPGKRPRIVAMTANALQGDRELCFAAGMDDYVAKPIRVEELVAALQRTPRRPDQRAQEEPGAAGGPGIAAGRRASRTSIGTRKPPVPAASAAVEATAVSAIDRAVFDRLIASMGGPFVAELIDTFVEDGRELIATLRRSLAETDVDAFRRAAHSLKSTSETVGASGLAGLARELETMARSGSLDGAEGRLEPLAGTYQIVTRTLGDLRRDLQG
jgi:PAS domain S-box-containing protein